MKLYVVEIEIGTKIVATFETKEEAHQWLNYKTEAVWDDENKRVIKQSITLEGEDTND